MPPRKKKSAASRRSPRSAAEDKALKGSRVLALLEAKGWNQFDLSMRCKPPISPAVISQVVLNRKEITLPTAVRLADALDTSLDYLAGRTSDPKRH